MHTGCHGIQHISPEQASHFLFVFSLTIGSFKRHDCIKIIIAIFQQPHKHSWPKLLPYFSNGFGAKQSCWGSGVFLRGLPGSEDEKQSTWCRLGMAWTSVRDSKWHIHRLMYECISQLAPRDYFEITFYLCLGPFAVTFYTFSHILPHSIWIKPTELGFLCCQTRDENHICVLPTGRAFPTVWYDSDENNTFSSFYLMT